jgi:hypothetical protein
MILIQYYNGVNVKRKDNARNNDIDNSLRT